MLLSRKPFQRLNNVVFATHTEKRLHLAKVLVFSKGLENERKSSEEEEPTQPAIGRWRANTEWCHLSLWSTCQLRDSIQMEASAL